MQSIVHVLCGLLSASIVSVAVSTSEQSVVDLHGTARAASGRPARDTVVWLEAPERAGAAADADASCSISAT